MRAERPAVPLIDDDRCTSMGGNGLGASSTNEEENKDNVREGQGSSVRKPRSLPTPKKSLQEMLKNLPKMGFPSAQ